MYAIRSYYGLVPERAQKANPQGWSLTIDGEVQKPLKITLDQLKSMPSETYALMIECGGNGRGLFNPPVRGNQWKRGAVACAKWTGVPLANLLREAGLKSSAVYTGHYGEDPVLSGSVITSYSIHYTKLYEISVTSSPCCASVPPT